VGGWWSATGGSDAVPRHGPRDGSYPEIDDELGARPRPTIPNDKVSTSGAPLLRFTKPFCGDGAVSTSGMLASVAPPFGARRGGAGVGRRIGSGAEFPEDFIVIFSVLGFLSAKCAGLRVILDNSASVCTCLDSSLI
jgi:hypothetical protein